MSCLSVFAILSSGEALVFQFGVAVLDEQADIDPGGVQITDHALGDRLMLQFPILSILFINVQSLRRTKGALLRRGKRPK
jgi:hypothetical protein